MGSFSTFERWTAGAMSTVWSIPASAAHPYQILRFLRDARCTERTVEVKLFGTDSLYRPTPVALRRWGPSADLRKTPTRSRST